MNFCSKRNIPRLVEEEFLQIAEYLSYCGRIISPRAENSTAGDKRNMSCKIRIFRGRFCLKLVLSELSFLRVNGFKKIQENSGRLIADTNNSWVGLRRKRMEP